MSLLLKQTPSSLLLEYLMIDIQYEGVIAFERFVGKYNQPADSLYFRPITLALITRHAAGGKQYVFAGDSNAYFEKNIHDIFTTWHDFMYNIHDDGTDESDKALTRMC